MSDLTPLTAEQILTAVRGGARLAYLPSEIAGGDPGRRYVWLDRRKLTEEEEGELVTLFVRDQLYEERIEAGVIYLHATAKSEAA